jgi:hypothetical protein
MTSISGGGQRQSPNRDDHVSQYLGNMPNLLTHQCLPSSELILARKKLIRCQKHDLAHPKHHSPPAQYLGPKRYPKMRNLSASRNAD